MRGEFIGVWAETWHEIWFPLIDEPLGDNKDVVPFNLFCELYWEVARALKAQPSIEALADVIDDPVQSREAFEKTTAADLTGERAASGPAGSSDTVSKPRGLLERLAFGRRKR